MNGFASVQELMPHYLRYRREGTAPVDAWRLAMHYHGKTFIINSVVFKVVVG